MHGFRYIFISSQLNRRIRSWARGLAGHDIALTWRGSCVRIAASPLEVAGAGKIFSKVNISIHTTNINIAETIATPEGCYMSVDDVIKTIKIENVVASTSIASKIDLEYVAKTIEGVDYNKKRFPGAIYRLAEPKLAVLVFGSGKIVCTGAKKIKDVEIGAKKIFEKLEEIGINTEGQTELVLHNIVSSADLGCVINLDAVTMGLGFENIEYEPEQFPGLVYRIKEPKSVVLLFGSGKMIITGCKSPEDSRLVVINIVHDLGDLGLL